MMGRPVSRFLARTFLVVITGLAIPTVATAIGVENPFKSLSTREREAIRRYLPTPIVFEGRPLEGSLETRRVRVYADREYRVGLFSWKSHVRGLLSRANAVTAPLFGVTLEAVELREWDRPGSAMHLDVVLEELAKGDPGIDVDWVIGLVAGDVLETDNLDNIGRASSPGRHFVMRNMSSPAEAQSFARTFRHLHKAELDALYVERKRHKELAVFLHEWCHTLGASHTEDPMSILFPSHSPRAHRIGPETLDAVREGLAARRREVPSAAASDLPPPGVLTLPGGMPGPSPSVFGTRTVDPPSASARPADPPSSGPVLPAERPASAERAPALAACERSAHRGAPKKAVPLCRRAVTALPRSPRAHYLLGWTLAESGKQKEAIDQLWRAVALDPSHAETLLLLGQLYRDQGRGDEFRRTLLDKSEKQPAPPIR